MWIFKENINSFTPQNFVYLEAIVYSTYPNFLNILKVKCTRNEACAILHRFHILYIFCHCDSKVEILHAFQAIYF